jgi:hypothetical protein
LVVFDNTNDLIQESQRNIKQSQLKIKEQITKFEKETSLIENRILKFKKALDNSIDETDIIKVLSRQINTNEEQLNEKNIELSKLKIEYELQNEKFNQTLLEMTYYDVKERINDWFFKLNVEEQRNELIRIIKSCKIFNHHIIIDTGKIIFIFDIDQHYIFDMSLLENLNKDEVYKTHFIEMKGKRKARTFNDKMISDFNLTKDTEIKVRILKYMIQNLKIKYDITETENIVSFVSFKGLYSD